MKNFSISLAITAFFLLAQGTVFSQSWSGIRGEGPKVTKKLDLERFDGFSLSFNARVLVRQGSPQAVEVEAQENILNNIETNVSGGRWKIKFDQNVRNHDGVTIWITIPTLTEASISGSGDIVGETPFNGLGDLKVGVSGSGDIKLDVEAKNISSGISGSGDITLGGSAGKLDVRISGSGDIRASDLSADYCSVHISGSGDVEVNAREDLEVSTSGSGDVYYRGRPRVKAKVSGSGKVEPKGEG